MKIRDPCPVRVEGTGFTGCNKVAVIGNPFYLLKIHIVVTSQPINPKPGVLFPE